MSKEEYLAWLCRVRSDIEWLHLPRRNKLSFESALSYVIDRLQKEIKTDCCMNCKYYHRLKHNFEVNKGFEDSFCCDVLMKGEPGGWIQEVSPNDMCEMFARKETKNETK